MCCDNVRTRLQKLSFFRTSWQLHCHFKLLIFIQTSNSNPSLTNLVKEGNRFAKIGCRWVNRYLNQLMLSSWEDFTLCDANPLSLLLCLCCCLLVFVLSPLCVTYAHACTWIIHQYVMHECISLCVLVCVLHLPPLLACLPVHYCMCLRVCVSQRPCQSHPPLHVTDVHRDWQFGWHDLRSQHQRPELLRGRGPELGRRWRRRWLRLRRWGQTERH